MFTEIITDFERTNLCNELIKSAFLTYLRKLNYAELDMKELYTIKNDACLFVINSSNNDHLKIVIEFWKFQANLYVGNSQNHYANDANVRNENEKIRLIKELDVLFNSSIVEDISENTYKLTFHDRDNLVVKKFHTSLNKQLPFDGPNQKNVYKPWL